MTSNGNKNTTIESDEEKILLFLYSNKSLPSVSCDEG